MGIHDYWDDGNAPDWGDEEDSEWGNFNPDPDWVEDQQEVELAFDILVHTSGKAYLLQFDEKNVWLPKSKATINMSMHKILFGSPSGLCEKRN